MRSAPLPRRRPSRWSCSLASFPLLCAACAVTLAGAASLAACDEKEQGAPSGSPSARPDLSGLDKGMRLVRYPDAGSDASATAVTSDASTTAGDAAPEWDGAMPPRPVPKSSPTVNSGMPMETQLQAIGYMAAMAQPRFDDAAADPNYAQNLATQLKPIAMSIDHGSAEEKAKLNRVEVVASGRRIDLLLANGCDAETPRRAVVTRANLPLSTLLSHGVLVVRCNDARVQCLQSTRDPTDVLCTTAPRHK